MEARVQAAEAELDQAGPRGRGRARPHPGRGRGTRHGAGGGASGSASPGRAGRARARPGTGGRRRGRLPWRTTAPAASRRPGPGAGAVSPVRSADRGRYAADWPQISVAIRFGRAGGQCECAGEYGAGHAGRCEARHGQAHPVTGSLVVLTTAHRDHVPELLPSEPLRSLPALSPGYDSGHHAMTRARTRQAPRHGWYGALPGPWPEAAGTGGITEPETRAAADQCGRWRCGAGRSQRELCGGRGGLPSGGRGDTIMTDELVSEMTKAEKVRRCNSCPGPASCSEFGRCVLKMTQPPTR